MKIVTLIENTARRNDLSSEHGLSLYIETDDLRIMFDTGQSGAFADNAEKLGIDLAKVDFAVLSHGHYDHGGGLMRFMEINPTAPIYLSRKAFAPCYNAAKNYIGLDPALRDSPRLRYVDRQLELGDGIRIVCADSLIPHVNTENYGLCVLKDGEFVPDDFSHEQYLLIREKGKTVCFSGCSHKGILNIIRWFRADILVGGFHFMKVDTAGSGREFLDRAAQELLSYGSVYYTGHCTGESQFAYLKECMGHKLHGISAGDCLIL